ncbi:disintegrin and metallo ase domain-containing 10 isoform X1 [Brachionus plicatilis]|uniref:ADAM10 endopeptidase n=1 Tax=Brachionus plicatilis TaxID=10195 RepID=A0A3M7RW94_BRAPC|nr:disintegrin and metallo ase domain-containing 10 isoform X1 [Brachionus plicatilis]
MIIFHNFIEIKPIKGSINFDESESFKYSREANLRKKRQTETFPDGRNVCNLYLKIDPYLYDTIFNNEGGQDDILTRNYLIYYLEKQVESLNSIFNQITTSGFFQNLRFITENIRIYKLSDCPNLGSPENKICENYLDAITLLNHVSLNNFDQYCLSYTFTSRDFADGTLGLAWLASADGTIGGICQKRATVINETKSLNSGIVSLVSFGSRVPERVNQITFAHEVGHSLGAKHDPETSECQPGGSSGNFIMFSRATSGNQPNNDIFSSCSIQDVNSVFINLFTSKNCLKSASDINAICGNGIIENEEVCDPGDSGLTKCCAADCRSLISGECDPSQGGCCDPSTCRFYTNEKVCLIGNDCRGDVKCTNLNAKCPVDEDINFKEDLSLCNENSQVCRNGSCTDSICDLYELKQCYIVGNLSDPKVNKSELCLLACTGAKTSNQCKLTRDIADFGGRSYSLRPGSSCSEMNGYCDIFSKCRAVNSQSSLTRLASTLLSATTITIEDIATFATTYWWAILLFCIAFLAINGIIFLCIILHINSDNPEKSLGYSFRQTLKRPFQVLSKVTNLNKT